MRKNLLFTVATVLALGSVSAIALTAPTSRPKAPARVDDASVALTPNEVGNLSIKWQPTDGCFDISFTAPTAGSAYDWTQWDYVYGDLTSIDRIVVQLYNGWNADPTILKVFENPQPGEALSYRETGLERGKTYNFQVYVYCGGESAYTQVANILAGALPDKATDLTVTSSMGQMPLTVSFTAPSSYKDYPELTLSSLTKAVLSVKDDGYWSSFETVKTIEDIEPGKPYSFEVNELSYTGAVTFSLTVYNEDGASDAATVNSYIGVDTPGSVRNLKAVEAENGDVVLTWEAPVAGTHNGYFDSSALTYIVKSKNSNGVTTTLADALTETTYTYHSTASEPEKYSFTVTAVSAAGQGTETTSPELIVGSALTLPFTEGFDQGTQYSKTYDHLWGISSTCEDSYPPNWYVSGYSYVGSSQVTPESGEGGLVYINTYDYTPVADFMLTSSKINVEGEAAVELSYSIYIPTTEGDATFKSEISFDNGATYTPVASNVYKDAENTGWHKVCEVVLVPANAKTAIIRFTFTNAAGVSSQVILDSITLKSTEAPAVIYPSSVSDLNAVKDKENGCIKVTMTAPTLTHASLGDVNGEPLTHITCIKLLRQIGYANDYVLVHTFENPAPGAELVYEDKDISEPGEYRYRALVYINDLSDYGNYTDNPVTIGQIPLDVTELKAASTRGAAPVVISFRAPAKDIYGDDLEALKSIVVTRYNTDTFVWDEIATVTENIVPGEIHEVTDANVVAGNIYEYRVTANGTAGNAYGVTTSVYVGADQPLQPANVTATVGDDGHVVVTWEPVTEGMNNGYVDSEHMTYVVQRGNGYSDYDASMLASGISGTTYTDPTEYGEEEIVKYFVKAVSNGIDGYSGISNALLVGQPSSIPYIENFENVVGDYIQADHSTWTMTSSEPASVWAFAELAYFIYEGQIQPVDGGHGLAYAYYGPYSTAERDDYLTSGNIDVTSTPVPELTFNVYGVPGYDNSLAVEVSFDGEDFNPVKTFTYNIDFETEGWQKVTLPIAKPSDAKTMRLRFHAHKGAYSCSVAIDNLRVDSEGSGIASVTPVNGVMVASVDHSVVVTGAGEATVVIADLSGRVIYTGTGDCKVPVIKGIYIVKVGQTSLKLQVQ